jgi:ubiquinone/menaquinone biosynthesis C-methylase UbiE
MSEARRRIVEHYTAEAAAFDRHWAPTLRLMSTALLPHLPLERARRVVDVGCGTGGLIPALREAAPGATVFGVDLTEGMLELARRNTGAPLAAMAAEQLGLSGQSVDVAVFSFVLHRVGQPGEALRETARVLAPGGVVGIVSWGQSQSSEAGRVWSDELAGLGLPREPEMIANHALLDAPDKLERLLLQAGLATARGWRRRFERPVDRDGWLRSQLGFAAGRRLAALPEGEREAFARRVRSRVESLGAEAFVYRAEAVFALGYTAARSPHRSGRK